MRFTLKHFVVMAFLFATGLTACKKWDDHNALTDAALNKTLLAEIGSRSNLSKFSEYLQKTGLDKEITSSKVYTVWAPTNDALAALDPAIVADTAKLRLFLTNHIANEAHYTRSDSSRIPMLNGKWITLVGKKFDDASITEADVKTGNGVLQVVDKAVLPLQNAWDFINATTTQYKQNAFIVAQTYKVQDLTNAIVDSISSATGKPIYKPGTDSVTKNLFRTSVADLKDETKQFTYFVMTDAALQLEADSLRPYFTYASGTAAQDYQVNWMTVRDLAIEGLYTIDKLPTQIKTKYGVLPIDKSAIVETRRVSNGIVYIFNKIDFRKEDKIQPVIVQGENPYSFMPGYDKRSVTFYRVRNDSLGKQFQDIVVGAHAVSGYYIQYKVPQLSSMKYKISWVALNDFYPNPSTLNGAPVAAPTSFTQKLAMTTSSNIIATVAVPVNTYAEQQVGTVTLTSAGTGDIFLVANGTTPLTLDYIKFTPVFQ